jgi:hypothetical protein
MHIREKWASFAEEAGPPRISPLVPSELTEELPPVLLSCESLKGPAALKGTLFPALVQRQCGFVRLMALAVFVL